MPFAAIFEGVKILEDSLPFRCRYRLELTLVFGVRDLNSEIQQTVRSGI